MAVIRVLRSESGPVRLLKALGARTAQVDEYVSAGSAYIDVIDEVTYC